MGPGSLQRAAFDPIISEFTGKCVRIHAKDFVVAFEK